MITFDNRIWVVLVNYNGALDTIDCIKSLNAQTIIPYVAVVDNSSTDNSCDLLRNEYSESDNVFLIRAKSNNGFSAGNNIGIEFAKSKGAEYILLLNNDTIASPNLIEEFLIHSDINTAISPRINYYSKKDILWYGGGHIDRRTARATHIAQDTIDCYDVNLSTPKETGFLTGCCIWIPVALLNKVGLLDEDYFMYSEDVDYSIRLKENGAKLMYLPSALIYHKVGSSAGVGSIITEYYGNRNRILLLRKHKFPLSAWLFTYFSRIILYTKGLVFQSNQRIIGKAIIDATRDVRGKVDL